MADAAGGEGRAAHGMDPKDFHHTGLRLEWGHEHSPDAFEVFSLAVSHDGTAVAAGGACPTDPGVAVVKLWLLGDDDVDSGEMTGVARARSGANASTRADIAASNTARCAHVLRADGGVAALSVCIAGDVCVAGTADGSVWAWNVRDGTLRWGGVDHEPHPALAKLPRRRRRDRNPFAAFIGRNDPAGYEAKQVRFLVAPPTPSDPVFVREYPHQRQLVVGSVGGHAVFPVWDAGTGECPDKGIGPCGWARDADWRKDDSLCHVAHSRCGFLLYTTTVDAKEVRAWSVYGSFGGDAAVCAWRSDRLAVRGLRLAGLVALPRTGGAGGELVATCCAPMVDGTCYAEPDAPLKIVLIDAEDGSEVRRFLLEGVSACNRFIDCGSLAGGGGGTLLFLAHRDGSIWVHNSRSGAQVAALHSHSTWAGSSGHHRLLPACVATGHDGEFLWSATTDGMCVHRYQVGAPRTWTRKSHARFPAAFKRLVRELVTSVHVRNARGGVVEGTVSGGSRLAAGPGLRGEQVEDSGGKTRLWGEGFAEVCAIEPAIMELVVARIARLTYGSRVET